MAVVLLMVAFLISKAQSQIYGLGPYLDPCPYGPVSEINGPVCVDPYGTISQPVGVAPGLPFSQPNLNNLLPQASLNQIPPYPNLINQPFTTNPIPSIPQPLFTNIPQQQLTPSVITNPVPQFTTPPVVATTIVDNTLANSLANAIQLLIVSNLIENTLGSSSGCGNVLAQSLGLLDTPCINNYEVVTSVPAVTCEYPVIDYNPCVNDVPCYQEPVVYQSPCADVTPCATSFGTGCGPSFSLLGDPNSFGFGNCGPNPMFGIDAFSNQFGSPATPIIPSFGCVEPAVATIAPMAVEVPFPASIPAQLTCNFGYLPTNVPCVSVNVEPLPFDGCRNIFGNFGNNGFNY